MWHVIAEETYARSGTVGKPQIEISVVVPIDDADGPGIINLVEPYGGRNVGEAACLCIKETTIPLASAK